MDMSPREFSAFLEEERQYRTPEQIDDLMRRYNQANTFSGWLSGLLAPQEGRRRTNFAPASVPEGMSLFDALKSGEAQLAVPQSIFDTITGTVRGVENPRLAAQGRIPAADMNSAGMETAAAAMGLGGLMTTLSRLGGRKPDGYDPATTNIFAGPRAKTADLDALKKAKELTARRRDPDDILKETGWFKGADNQWRFEIPDDKIEFVTDPTRTPEYELSRAAGLGDVIKHDELFEAYPELRGLLTQTYKDKTYGGYQPFEDRSGEGLTNTDEMIVASGPNRRDIESTLLHEIDHAIANREGFSGGTNQSDATSRILERQNIDLYNLEQRMEARERELGLNQFEYRPDTTDPELLQLRSDYDAMVGRSPSNQDIFATYLANMGEVAARNVQARRDMTAAERRETSPRLTEDTPREAQWTEGVISANASKSAGLLSVASDVADRGDQVLSLLKSGKGAEVTDAMLDMGDSVKNAQLNQYLAANYDLPMDETSRLARAREMGLLDPAFHSTGKDFLNFVPSEFRGASFFGATPEGASRGASASANEGVGSGSKITMPVRVDTSGVEGLGAYARKDMNEFRASLPDRIYTEAEVDALMASDVAPLRGNWSDFFDDLTDYDALRQFRDENPTKEIPDGIVKFRPKRSVSYSKDLKADLSGRQFAHYSEGMSERPTSEYVKSQGNTGFTMMDESGLALAMVDPTKVRSQFARFDPRLSHLSNVTAANASPLVGLLTQGLSEKQANKIEDYLYRTGLLQ